MVVGVLADQVDAAGRFADAAVRHPRRPQHVCNSFTFSSGRVSAVNTPAPSSLPARYFKRPGMR